MNIPLIKFDMEPMKLNTIFESDNAEKRRYIFDCQKIKDMYGNFTLGEPLKEYPLTYGSYVMSIDGKIAFEDDEVGPLIAKNNFLDKDGADADFWVLNLLRAAADAIIIGSGTLIKEPTYSGSTYDIDLIAEREKNGMTKAPVTAIVTRTGKGIPWKNAVFKTDDIKFIINTSPNGLESVISEIDRDYYVIDLSKSELDNTYESALEKDDRVWIVVTGKESETDADMFLKFMKRAGLVNILVESPSYCHELMKRDLLDEIFINSSCIFVGGSAVSIGSYDKSFTSKKHPHAEIRSIKIHKKNFIYTHYIIRKNV